MITSVNVMKKGNGDIMANINPYESLPERLHNCPNCGGTFNCLLCATIEGLKPPTPQAPRLLSAHFEDGHMGVSDFIGVKEESEAEDG